MLGASAQWTSISHNEDHEIDISLKFGSNDLQSCQMILPDLF